ncbi:MAG TPA: hypothetical protein VGR71_16235 [Nitrospira sp.]|nr:hypothetical protein [Nitrospira sp.]
MSAQSDNRELMRIMRSLFAMSQSSQPVLISEISNAKPTHRKVYLLFRHLILSGKIPNGELIKIDPAGWVRPKYPNGWTYVPWTYVPMSIYVGNVRYELAMSRDPITKALKLLREEGLVCRDKSTQGAPYVSLSPLHALLPTRYDPKLQALTVQCPECDQQAGKKCKKLLGGLHGLPGEEFRSEPHTFRLTRAVTGNWDLGTLAVDYETYAKRVIRKRIKAFRDGNYLFSGSEPEWNCFE